MALILNIDTSLDTASVCLSNDDSVLAFAENKSQQEHASWLHVGIASLLQDSGKAINDIDAIAVSIGPGSYTGLRVGLSAAKGFCYALNLPLITVNTLLLIAYSAKDEAEGLICPLIDARRMEVFTALYSKDLNEMLVPSATIVDSQSFGDILLTNKVLFCGNGMNKVREIIDHPNALFSDATMNATHLSQLSSQFYEEKKFSDLAYTEPLYIKEFYSPARKNSL